MWRKKLLVGAAIAALASGGVITASASNSNPPEVTVNPVPPGLGTTPLAPVSTTTTESICESNPVTVKEVGLGWTSTFTESGGLDAPYIGLMGPKEDTITLFDGSYTYSYAKKHVTFQSNYQQIFSTEGTPDSNYTTIVGAGPYATGVGTEVEWLVGQGTLTNIDPGAAPSGTVTSICAALGLHDF